MIDLFTLILSFMGSLIQVTFFQYLIAAFLVFAVVLLVRKVIYG